MRIWICSLVVPFFILLFFSLFLHYNAAAVVLVPFTPSSSSPISSLNHTNNNGMSSECDALLRFGNSFTITEDASSVYCVSSYGKTASWKDGGSDCCLWDGVTCDPATSRVVVGLDLSCSWLAGTIQSNSTLFSLRNLQQINLAGNDFSGSPIPSRFGIFSELTHLNLSHSGFSATLTMEDDGDLGRVLRNLTQLRDLVLDSVDMSGVNPISLANLSSTLTYLSINFCYLQGTFPTDIFHLPNLRTLDLAGNSDLTGSLGALMNWSSPLFFLDLSFTQFHGPIPASIGNLTSMDHLDLSHSNFTGSIPATLGKLAHLAWLDLGGNKFSGAEEFEARQCDGNCSMPRLQYLSMIGCGVTKVPYFLISSAELTVLDLSENNITTQIPEWFWRVGRDTLTDMDLSSNNFTGDIPPWICQMPSLRELDLSYNGFNGTVPRCLGNLSRLYSLDLSSNLLHGSLPQSLANNTNLWRLDLHSNKLHGFVNEIPLPNQLQIFSLSSNNFEGPPPIPPPDVLTYWVASNNFTGGIPHQICNSTSRSHIGMDHNHLTGTIPRCLMNSSTLVVLDLRANSFHGSIDEIPLLNSVQKLGLSDNSFEGSLPIPSLAAQVYLAANNKLSGGIPHHICNSTNLEVIDLSNNHLTGPIPNCLMNLNGSLTVLDLRANMLSGQIPEVFVSGTSLKTIRFGQNRLGGKLPRSLAHCKNLEVLDLKENLLEGPFPYWLENLPSLQVLNLRSNRFYGPVDKSSGADRPFQKLRILDLSNNGFSGPLPAKYLANLVAMKNESYSSLQYMVMREDDDYYQVSIDVVMKGLEHELEKILTVFTTIDLSSNLFEGEIPLAIGDLKALKGLNFSHNNLIGDIPSSLGDLINLEWLDLSSNKLGGTIPRGLAGLTWLSFLNLSNNQLYGSIPHGPQFDTFTSDSFRGNPGLCGKPLPRACGGNNAGQTPPEETDSGSWIEWRAVLIGYGCGLAIAISAWYVMGTGRPGGC